MQTDVKICTNVQPGSIPTHVFRVDMERTPGAVESMFWTEMPMRVKVRGREVKVGNEGSTYACKTCPRHLPSLSTREKDSAAKSAEQYRWGGVAKAFKAAASQLGKKKRCSDWPNSTVLRGAPAATMMVSYPTVFSYLLS